MKRNEAFVLLTHSAPTENHKHSQEEKKYTSLWMKKHKAELRNLVLAMIVIESSAAKRVALMAFGVIFLKFWGYPLVLASTCEEALHTAEKLLLQSGKRGSI